MNGITQIGKLSIRERDKLNGENGWYVWGQLGERRIQRRFATLEGAQEFASEEGAQSKELGAGLAALSVTERMGLASAHARATSAGYSLFDAINFFERFKDQANFPAVNAPTVNGAKTQPDGKGWKIEKAYDEFIKAGKKRNWAKATVNGHECIRRKMVATIGNIKLRDLDSKKTEQVLDAYRNDYTWNQRLVGVSTFYAYCIKQKQMDEDFTKAFSKKIIDGKDTYVFGVATVEKILLTVLDVCPSAIAYYALALFAGIRPNEIDRMTWKDIRLDKGWLKVPKVKTRDKPRLIMLDNCGPLADWLTYAKSIGATLETKPLLKRAVTGWIEAGKKTRPFCVITKKAGLGEWVPDAPRHTFCSMHKEAYENAEKTNKIAGHGEDVSKDFYENIVTEDDNHVTRDYAKGFWKITPASLKVKGKDKEALYSLKIKAQAVRAKPFTHEELADMGKEAKRRGVTIGRLIQGKK